MLTLLKAVRLLLAVVKLLAAFINHVKLGFLL